MTSIQFLGIQGIRSFNPTSMVNGKIKFFKPLTLIVGSNGSGKTTIIECLNAACTGTMPPGSERGRHWIHDPRIEGETEVKAQVRLQFCAVTKKKILVIRSYQLTQKSQKKSGVFKQLSACIQTLDNDQKVQSASYRCTEVDKLIPSFMGISKPILESVIFCHQVDITWPLSESTKLKQKFDEIFASTRYSKALKAIKELQKQYNNSLKNYKGDLGVYKAYCEELEKMILDENSEKDKIKNNEGEIDRIEQECGTYIDEIGKYEELIEKIQEFNTKIQIANGEVNQLKKIVVELKENLKQEINDDDEQIRGIERNFKSQIKKLEKERISLEKSIDTQEESKNTVMKKQQKIATKLGVLQEQKESYVKSRARVSYIITQLAQKYQIPQYNNDEDDVYPNDEIFSFLSRLETSVGSYREKLSGIKKTNSKKQNEVSRLISEVNEKISGVMNTMKKNQKRIDVEMRKINKLKKGMKKVNISEEDVRESEDAVKSLEKTLEEKEEEWDLKELNERIGEYSDKIRNINKTIEDVSKRIEAREKEKVMSMRIVDMKKECKELEDKSSNVLKEVEDVVGEMDIEDVEKEVSKMVKTNKKKMKKVRKKISDLGNEIASVATKREMKEDEKNDLEKKKKKFGKKIEKVLPNGEEFEKRLDDVEKEENGVRNELGLINALTKCYKNFSNHAKDQNECLICQRSFDDDEELNDFMEAQKEKLEKTPVMIKEFEGKLKKSGKLIKKLQSISPLVEELKEIDTIKMPDLHKAIEKMTKNETEKSNKLESLNKELLELTNEEEKLEKVFEKSKEIKQILKKMKEVEKKVKREQKKLDKITSSSVSYENLKNELKENRNEYKKLNVDLEKARNEYQKKSKELEKIRKKISKEKEESHSKKMEFQKSQNMNEQISRINETIENFQNENLTSKESIPELKKEELKFESDLDDLVEKHENQEKKIQDQIDELQNDIQEVSIQVTQIKKYTSEGKEELISSTDLKNEKIKVSIDKLEKSLQKCRKDLKKKNEMIDKKHQIEQNLKDNLNYREKLKDYETSKKKLKKLKLKLSEETGSSEEIDEKVIKNKRRKYSRLVQRKSKIEGEMETHKLRIKKIGKDKKIPKFNKAHDKYRSTLIKYQTTKTALSDITKYYTALEKALLKYHEMKIKQINETIKELWEKTYRGVDIDTIEIRADKEGSRRGSYNYRVVMMKGTVALDMRGRCSAGQRILACLIIRLALAESFCLNFGVLSLDEPVQNLDHDNMISFADSLKQLIQERRKQANFQLIVITHNEEFASRLGSNDFVEHYYKISKDPETGFSKIEKKEFKERE